MYALLTCLSALFRLLPHKLALCLGALLGGVWYHLIPIRRRVALAVLATTAGLSMLMAVLSSKTCGTRSRPPKCPICSPESKTVDPNASV